MGRREDYMPVPQAEDADLTADAWSTKKPVAHFTRRTVLLGVASAVVLASIGYSLHHQDWPYDVIDTVANHTQSWNHAWDSITNSIAGSLAPSWTESHGPGRQALPDPYLFGNFMDQLKPASKLKYVTAVPLGGISNQMTGVLNLIVLGVRTNRAVILPPISPNLHQLRNRRGPSYDLFYDIPNLSNQLNQLPLLDWNKLRTTVPYHADQPGWEWLNTPEWKLGSQPLPCFISASMGAHGSELSYGFQSSLAILVEPKYAPGDEEEGNWKSMDIAQQIATQNHSQSQVAGIDKDVACFTSSYWMNGAKDESSDILGKMKFSAALEAYADKTIATSLGINLSDLPTTKFLTVHLRRNDVVQKCEPLPTANSDPSLTASQNASPNDQSLDSSKQKSQRQKRLDPDLDLDSDPESDSNSDSDIFDEFGFELDPIENNLQQRIQRRKPRWQLCHFTDEYVVAKVNEIRKEKFRNEDMLVLLATDDTNRTSLDFFKKQNNWFTIQRIEREDDLKTNIEGDEGASGEDLDDWSDYWNVMVDTAILTKGSGFLGTRVSTLSRTAAERGKIWYNRPAYWLGQ